MGRASCLLHHANGPGGLFEKAASGAGDERPLLASGELKMAMDWSPDGQWLLYNARHPKTGLDLWAAPMARDRKPVLVMDTTFDQTAGQFSPDGRWVAYQSNESKPVQIYIRPFPEPGGPLQVTTAGGSQPRWSPDGKELFYVGLDGRLMAVPIAVGADRQLETGTAVALFRAQLATGPNIISGGRGEGAVRSCPRRPLSDEHDRRGGERDAHHGRPQLGRGVEEVTIPLLSAPASATPSPASSRA